jgi:5'-nucleotidase
MGRTGMRILQTNDDGVYSLKQKRISVTSLKLDLTDYSVQDRVERALGYGVAD